MNLIQDVITGITKKLSNFKATVYVDEVKSNLDTPAFIVKLINHEHIRYPSNRFYKRLPIQVVYIPESDEDCSFEIYQVISELNYLLEVIELSDGSLIRGKDIDHSVENSVLYFYITYSGFERLVESNPTMDNMELKNGVEDIGN